MSYSSFGLGKDQEEKKFVAETDFKWKLTKDRFELISDKKVYQFTWNSKGQLNCLDRMSTNTLEAAKRVNRWRINATLSGLIPSTTTLLGTCSFIKGSWQVKKTEMINLFSTISSSSSSPPIPILHSIESLDLIKSPYPQDDKLLPITPSLIAHIFGDSFVHEFSVGSERLEGSSPTDIIFSFTQFLNFNIEKHFKHTANLTKKKFLLEFLNETLKFEKAFSDSKKEFYSGTREEKIIIKQRFSKWMINEILGIKNGERKLIPAGWNGKPAGHIIYLLIERKEESFNLIVFNAGAGITYHSSITHHQFIDEELTSKTKTDCLTFNDVPIVNFCDPYVWQAYFELRTYEGGYPELDEKDFYLRFLKKLTMTFNDKVAEPKFETSIKPHASGVCGWKSLAHCCKYLLSSATFRSIKIEFKVYLLNNLAYQLKKDHDFCLRMTKDKEVCQKLAESLEQMPKILGNLYHSSFELVDDILKKTEYEHTLPLIIPSPEEMEKRKNSTKKIETEHILLKSIDSLFASFKNISTQIPELISTTQKLSSSLLEKNDLDIELLVNEIENIKNCIKTIPSSKKLKIGLEQISYLEEWVNSYSLLNNRPKVSKVIDQYTLYTKSIEKFGRSLAKDLESTFISPETALEGFQTINFIKKELIYSKELFDKFGSTLFPSLSLKETSTLEIRVNTHFREEEVKEEMDLTSDVESIPEINLSLPLELNNNLKIIIKYISENLEEKKPFETSIYIEKIFNELPHVDTKTSSFWNKISKKDRTEVMQSLSCLTEKLLQSSISSKQLLECSQLNHFFQVEKIFAVIQQLYLSIVPKDDLLEISLAPQFLSHRLSNLSSKNPFFFILDPKHDHDLEQSLLYLKSLNGKKNYFNNLFEVEHDLLLSIDITEDICLEKKHNETHTLYKYINSKPSCKKKLLNAFIQKFKYDSSKIPDHWLVAMAMTDLKGAYLPKSYCALKKQFYLLQIFALGSSSTEPKSFQLAFDIQDSPRDIYWNPRIESTTKGIYLHSHPENIFSLDSYKDFLEMFNCNLFSGLEWNEHWDNKAFRPLCRSLYFQLDNPIKAKLGSIQNRFLTISPLASLSDDNEECHPFEVEHFRELSSLGWRDDKPLQIAKILGYFKRNRNLLSDGDYRQFCFCLLFEHKILRNHLHKNPEFAEVCTNFCVENYEYFINQNQIPTALFCFRIGRIIDSFIQYEIAQGGLIDKKTLAFPTPYSTLIDLINKHKEPYTRTLIIQELLATYSNATTLSFEDIFNIMRFGRHFRDFHPKKSDEQPFIKNSIDKLFCTITNLLKLERERNLPAFNKQMNEWLTIILKDVHPEVTTCEWSFDNFPSFISKDQLHIYSLSIGNLYTEGTLIHELPTDILHSQIFEDIIGVKNTRNNLRFGKLACTFDDSKGQKTSIINNKEKSYLFQKIINGKLFCGVTEKQIFLPEFLLHITRDEKCSYWYSEVDESLILCLSKKTNEILYSFNKEKIEIQSQIPGITKGLYLVNKDSSKNDFSLFSEFDKNYRAWKNDNGEVCCIELPTSSLTFYKDNKRDSKKIFSLEYPEFYLIDNSTIDVLNTLKGFLTIKNDFGTTQVIVYKNPLKHYSDKTHLGIGTRMTPEIQAEKRYSQEKQTCEFFVFDWCNKDKQLSSSDLIGNIYLGYLFLALQKYELASEVILYQIQKISRYTKEEVGIFYWFFSLDFRSEPDATTLILQVASHLVNNQKKFPIIDNTLEITLNSTMMECIRKSYQIYVQNYNNITIPRLTLEQELRIISLCSSSYKDRLTLLKDPATKFSKNRKYMEGHDEFTLKTNTDLNFSQLSIVKDEKLYFIKPETFNSLIRPKFAPVVSFSNIYRAAKNSKSLTPLQHKNLLLVTQLSSHHLNFWQMNILAGVLSSPKDFPIYSNLTKYLRSDQSSNPLTIKRKKDLFKSLSKTSSYFKSLFQFNRLEVPTVIPPKKSDLISTKLLEIPNIELPELVNKTLLFGSSGLFSKQEDHFTKTNEKKRIDKIQFLVAYLEKLEKAQDEPLLTHVICSTKLEVASLLAPQPPKWALNFSQLNAIELQLRKDTKTQEQFINALKNEIIILANKIPSSDSEKLLRKLQMLGKRHKLLELPELVLLYIKENFAAYAKRNNALTTEDVYKIRTHLNEFLCLSIQQEQRKRALICFEKISMLIKQSKDISPLSSIFSEKEEKIEKEKCEINPDLQLLIQELQTTLTAKNHVTSHYPEQLVFQYLTGMLLRKDQVDTLSALIDGKNADRLILQRMMGSGKSKVLLPLLALRHADGTNLAILVLPEELIEDASNQMQLSAKGTFHQSAIRLDWNDTSLAHLETIYKTLISIRDNRDFLLVSSKELSLFSLKAKAIRMDLENPQKFSKKSLSEARAKLKICRDILGLIKSSGYAVMDEIDILLDCRHEVHISHGRLTQLDESRYDLSILLNEIMFLDDHFLSLFDFDCLKMKGKGSLFSEEAFTKEKPEFIHRLINKLVLYAKNETKNTQNLLCVLGKNIEFYPDPNFRKWIEAYLADSPEFAEDINAGIIPDMMEKLNENQRDGWAFLREAIRTMVLTLSRNYNEHYGFFPDASNILAGPYAGAGNPKIGSEFGNYRELIMYTIQAYLYQGIPLNLLNKEISRLKDFSFRDSGLVEENFKNLCNHHPKYKISTITGPEIKQLLVEINSDNKRILRFVHKYILPSIMVPTSRMTFHAQQFVELFNKTQGFSGTPWNRTTYHSKLLTQIEEGLDARTWYAVGDEIAIVKSIEPVKLLAELDKMKLLHKSNAIIDAGALFKEIPDHQIAELFFNQEGLHDRPHKISSIINYVSNTQKIQKGKGSHSQSYISGKSNPIECFTVYDQKHCTGSDIPQASKAHAIVTINKNTKIRDLQQSVWRMRGLESGQTITLCVPEKVEDLIRKKISKSYKEPLTVVDVMIFALINQAVQVMEDNVVSIKQKIQNAITQTCEEILSIVPPENLGEKHYQELENIDVTFFDDSPYVQFGKINPFIKANLVIQKYKEYYLSKITTIIEKMKSHKIKEFDLLTTKTLTVSLDNYLLGKSDPPILESLTLKSNEHKKFIAFLDSKMINLNQNLESLIKEVTGSLTPLLPKKLQVQMDLTVETTIEQQVEQELEQEDQIDLSLYSALFDNVGKHREFPLLTNLQQIFSSDYFTFSKRKITYPSLDLRSSSSLSLTPSITTESDIRIIPIKAQDILSEAEVSYVSKISNLFDDEFYLSEAFVNTAINKQNPLGFFRKRIGSLLVVQQKESEKISIILLSAGEAGQIQKFLADDKFNSSSEIRDQLVCLYRPDQDIIVQQGFEPIHPKKLSENPQFNRLLVQARFFDGEVFYKKQEQEALDIWLSSQDNPELIETFFSKEVIKWQAQSRKYYPKSYLCILLDSLIKRNSKKRRGIGESSRSESDSKVEREFESKVEKESKPPTLLSKKLRVGK